MSQVVKSSSVKAGQKEKIAPQAKIAKRDECKTIHLNKVIRFTNAKHGIFAYRITEALKGPEIGCGYGFLYDFLPLKTVHGTERNLGSPDFKLVVEKKPMNAERIIEFMYHVQEDGADAPSSWETSSLQVPADGSRGLDTTHFGAYFEYGDGGDVVEIPLSDQYVVDTLAFKPA